MVLRASKMSIFKLYWITQPFSSHEVGSVLAAKHWHPCSFILDPGRWTSHIPARSNRQYPDLHFLIHTGVFFKKNVQYNFNFCAWNDIFLSVKNEIIYLDELSDSFKGCFPSLQFFYAPGERPISDRQTDRWMEDNKVSRKGRVNNFPRF